MKERTTNILIYKNQMQISKKLRPLLGFVPIKRVKDTLAQTTQLYRATTRLPFRKHLKSRFPAANVTRLNEDVAHDTMFCDTPAHDDGIKSHGGTTMAQLYTGCTSNLSAIFPMKEEGQIPGTLEEFIRKWGAPKRFRSDLAKAAISNAATQIMRHYCIGDWQSEAYHQHQNKAENKMHKIKTMMNGIMDRYAIPAKYWLLIVLYVVDLMNHLSGSDGSPPPLTRATGQPTDTSAYMIYHPWELVYYPQDDSHPQTKEALGRWLGPADSVGDTLTYNILTLDTGQLIYRSNVRSAENTSTPNKRALSDISVGENSTTKPNLVSPSEILNHIVDVDSEDDTQTYKTPVYSPAELVGMTFLRDQEDGTVIRAKI